LDLVEVRVGMKADAALRRSPRDVVLHPISLEDAQPSAVELHREAHDELASYLTEHGAKAGREVEDVRGVVELPLGVEPWILGTERRRGGDGHGQRLPGLIDAGTYSRAVPVEVCEISALDNTAGRTERDEMVVLREYSL